MVEYTLQELSAIIVKYVRAGEDLPEPYCDDPTCQALRALWSIILHPGKNQNVRMQALREYFDRVLGKAGALGERSQGTEEVDLGRLSGDEAAELVRLLNKAKGTDDDATDQ